MENRFQTIVGLIFCCIVLSAQSFAGNLESTVTINQTGHQFNENIVKVDPNDIQTIPDNYGNFLYFYKDGSGNDCVTNSPENISSAYRIADASGRVFRPEKNLQLELVKLNSSKREEDEIDFEDSFEGEDISINDPLEPLNRAFFKFNDKMYFWLLKPVSSGYKTVVPTPARKCVSNFFNNIEFPIRFVNCILQGKFMGAHDEFGRFLANSIAGVGGLFDAATMLEMKKGSKEDFGQTLGVYGLEPGFYINWPFLGPSSARDTFGMAADSFLDPVRYMVPRTDYRLGIDAYERINKTSFRIGDYEDLKKSALDPYVALRDAYYQYRKNKINE